ncbi:flavin reductase [Microbacterium paludicola]|uniref:Flavin reductase n=1 Tax=Microbacterium paludicola TaxID=300019 RepID=A0A4Y9FTB1_9MICO|nr:flavin reductase family protein [Microbacterium paludicola]MBF0817166.1 flavin reductase family protein [Microbacterium paludicola]TFU32094.1 flavin reductase [Microbacterium paludicola]
MQTVAPTTTEIDARRFRDVLGHYASGITIVTGHDGDEPIGFTCQSFYSVSVDPPLVSFSVMKTSTTYPRIAPTGRFAVNVLSRDQTDVSAQFARKGTDKWAGIDWSPAASGNPVIAETLMWVDCELWAEHDAGDHLIVIGKVTELSPERWHDGEPLLFFKGRYRHLREIDQAAI